MKYRNQLPQLTGKQFITDGGLETKLMFLDGIPLTGFAAINMLVTPALRAHLRTYFEDHIALARGHCVGFVLESPTWRSSHGWAAEVGQSVQDLDEYNRLAIEMMLALQQKHDSPATPMVVSGCIGPQGDGYVATNRMTIEQAREYHQRQIDIFADAGADLVSAMTMNYVEEAIGIVLAAKQAQIPSVIGFTVETDGRLYTGETLEQAIKTVDAATSNGPAYYMINCSHPTHFASSLDPKANWVKRIKALRANASSCSHAELDNSPELDIGNPVELGRQYLALTTAMPHINVVGGCCGTDIRHIAEIARHRFGTSSVTKAA